MRKGGERPANGLAVLWAGSLASFEGAEDSSLKLTERTGNVYENKGPVWKGLERSGNVVDNKDA